MTFDLARDESEQRLQSMPGTKTPQPDAGYFDNFFRGTGMAAMRTFAQAGRALDLAAAAPGLAFAQLTGRYDAIDRFFKSREDFGAQRAIDYWTPKPGEVGVAGEVVGTLLATLPLVIANPPAAVAQFGLSQGQDAVARGASAMQGAGVATVMGGGFGLGVWLPMLGGTLLQRAGIGAGANVAQGIAMRGAAGKIVEGTPAADMFHAFDGQEITIDLLMGLAFGGLAHGLPAWRRQSDASNKAFLEGYAKIKDWALNLKPSDIEALATLRMAQHKNADSLPGAPVGPEDVDAHVARVNRALEQVAADEPVHVDDLPAAKIARRDGPPTDESAYLNLKDYREGLRAQYVKDGQVMASSRNTPSIMPLPPVGTWRIDDYAGSYGREVAQLREVRIADLVAPELDTAGALDPVKRGDEQRYAEWIREGKRAPPIEVLETDKGSLQITDGHRRLLAAKAAGRETVEAWVSPAMDVPSGMRDPEGRPIRTGMTFERMRELAGVDPRVEEANAQLRMLEEVAETEAVTAGLPPREIPFEERPAYQAVRQALETLDQAGKFGPDYVDASAKIADAFLTAAARRTGRPLEEIIKRYLPTLTNKPPEGTAALDQGRQPLLVDMDNQTTPVIDLIGEPPVPEGMVRLYRGGGPSGRWYSANRETAEQFMFERSRKGRLTFVDVTPEDANAYAEAAIATDAAIDDEQAHVLPPAVRKTERVLAEMNGRQLAIHYRTDGGTLWQAAPTFYSELGRQIEAAKMKAAPAKGWMDFIRGLQSKGVKAEEVKWSGIEEWLDVQGRQFKVDDYIDELNAKYGTKTEGNVTTPGWTEADLTPDERAHLEKLASEPDNQGRVTKEQVQAFLEQGGVKVEEVMLGGEGAPNFGDPSIAADMALLRERGWEAEQNPEDMGVIAFFDEDSEAADAAQLRRWSEADPENNPPEVADAAARIEAYWYGRTGARAAREGPAKFSQYQLPGGKNYRELLLTLPGKIGASAEALDPLIRSLSHWPNDPHTARDPARQAELDELNAEWERRDRANIDRGPRFTESHWEQPNVLAHVRFNERTDADGKRVLFVEEIQSDWAQKGKKQGFAKDTNGWTAQLLSEPDAGFTQWQINDASGNYVTKIVGGSEEAAIRKAAEGIPAAPFVTKTDSWTALVVKRMIHYASVNGFERVAWTRGEQQVERYTNALRKAVDAIEWKKTPEGIQIIGYKGTDVRETSFAERSRLEEAAHQARRAAMQTIRANDNLGFDNTPDAVEAIWTHRTDWAARWGDMPVADQDQIQLWIDRAEAYARTERGKRTKVVDTTEKEDALSDAIGKAMADKIISDPAQEGVIEGEGIHVSDTGMSGFYDRIVPKIVNDVLKKLGGGKVGEIDLGVGPYTIEAIEQVNRFRVVETHADQNNGNGTFVTGPLTYEAAQKWIAENRSGEGVKQHAFDITPELRERAKKGMPLFQGGAEQPRGYFQMGEDGPKIGLLEHADRSTFLHESGHFFLEVTSDLAREPDAPAELKADMQTLLDWFKVDAAKWDAMSLDEKRPHHEQFARGFERYVAEGKAPVPELQGVFERFKAWLLDIYQSLRGLNVKLSDEVRGVMDRMLGGALIAPDIPKPVMPHRVSLLDDIRALGGIRKDALQDITGEARTGKRVKGLPPGLFKEGGKGVDDLATMLRDHGWPIPEDDVDGGVQGLKDLIAKELAGETTLKLDEDPNVLKPLAEQDAAAVFERYAELETKAAEAHDFTDSADYRAEIQRLRTQRDYELASVLSGEGLHLEAEARRITADNPDLTITLGEDADGTPIRQSARDMLDAAERDAKAIEDQEPLMIEAAECIAGVG